MDIKASILIAVIVGILNHLFLILCWGYIAIHSPVLSWTIELGFSNSAGNLITLSVDFLINIVLSVPAAYAIYKLKPKKLWLYISLAVIPSFLSSNHLLITEPSRLTDYVSWYAFLPGWIMHLTAIPAAVAIIYLITKNFQSKAVGQAQYL